MILCCFHVNNLDPDDNVRLWRKKKQVAATKGQQQAVRMV